MIVPPASLFIGIWGLWAISWGVAALWSAPTEKRSEGPRVWHYRAVVTLGIVLLWHRTGKALHAPRLWHVGYGGAYALAGLTLAGILFTWWARIHLGRLWSGSVTRKEGHRVVDTGPYALVRHPIYTGLIAASLMTALAIATWVALAGVLCIAVGLWMKAKLEEGFLAQELGPAAYEGYRARVAMLVPFIF